MALLAGERAGVGMEPLVALAGFQGPYLIFGEWRVEHFMFHVKLTPTPSSVWTNIG